MLVCSKITFSESYKGKIENFWEKKGIPAAVCPLHIFCGFISHLIGGKTIGVHGFMGKAVKGHGKKKILEAQESNNSLNV